MAETKLSTTQLGGDAEVFNENNLLAGNDIKLNSHVETTVIADGFSGTKYLVVSPNVFNLPYGKSWYIKLKFKTPASTASSPNYLLGGAQDFYACGIAFELGSDGSGSWRLGCGLSYNGTSWDIGWSWQEEYSLASDTWYYVKVSYQGAYGGGMYDFAYSTDDVTYTTIRQLGPENNIHHSDSMWLQVGNTHEHAIGYYKGAIDIGSFQIYVDNAFIFNGAVDYNNPDKITWYNYSTVPTATTTTYKTIDATIDTSVLATKSEVATKQDTISDLATIRSGAAAGATAVQPSALATVATSGDYDDLTNKPAAATDMTGADGTNAGTHGLVPAPSATDNVKFLRGDGTWAEAGGSSVTVDQTYDATSTNAQSGTAVAQAVAGVHIPNFTRTWYKNNTGNTLQIVDTSSALSVAIYRNGALLEPTDDYTISGTTLTLVDALTASEKITVEVYQ